MPNKKKYNINEKNVIKDYVDGGKSTSEIAKPIGCNPNVIRRILIKHNITLRTKSEAQSAYLADNPHPMKGVKLTEEQKKQRSLDLERYYSKLTKKEKDAIDAKKAEINRKNWNKDKASNKKIKIRKMHVAKRMTTKSGSRFENMLIDYIRDQGYNVFHRTKQYSGDGKTEIDICLPSEKVAIEVDGPTHFANVFGSKILSDVKKRDNKKNQTLINGGFTVIRVRNPKNKTSRMAVRKTFKKITDIMEKKDLSVHIIVVE